jgi:prepilin signal peptidase PulO-like enzyme (type II secretory pathway)
LGDVLMLGMIGSFLGLFGGVFALMTGSIVRSIAGLVFIALSGKDAGAYQLPLGSFLGLGALASQWFGDAVLSWYTAQLSGVF